MVSFSKRYSYLTYQEFTFTIKHVDKHALKGIARRD